MIPHLSLPVRIVGTAAAVNDQDTLDELADCVQAIVRFPVGYRTERPTFGIPDLPFRQGGPDAEVIAAAVRRWEPRVHPITTATLDELIGRVSIDVQPREEG